MRTQRGARGNHTPQAGHETANPRYGARGVAKRHHTCRKLSPTIQREKPLGAELIHELRRLILRDLGGKQSLLELLLCQRVPFCNRREKMRREQQSACSPPPR